MATKKMEILEGEEHFDFYNTIIFTRPTGDPNETATKKVEVIGGEENFWLYSEADGYDLTHPSNPYSSPTQPRLSLKTTTGRVAIDPTKTALVVVDLQNYFLSPILGRPADSPGLKVVDRLIDYVIPSCRKAGIPVWWMGWGFQNGDLWDGPPPSTVKGFAADSNFVGDKKVGDLGSDIGPLELEDGKVIEGDEVLMQGQWNTEFYPRLADAAEPQDIWTYKNCLLGFESWHHMPHELGTRDIRTLLFSGANTDQGVAASLQGAVRRNYDCLLLRDACATTSPEFCTQCIEYSCERDWGFVLSCKDLTDGVDNMLVSEKDKIGPSN